MNLPNKLSLARLLLMLPFVGTFYLPMMNARTWALILFVIASLTDLADGIIARRHGLITNFGKLIDPLADKVLMTGALILLTVEGQIPSWVVILILAREFIVTGIRQIAVSQGVVLAAESLGKHKMIWQVIMVLYFLIRLASAEPMVAFMKPVFEMPCLGPEFLGRICVAITTGLTVISGWRYFWLNRQLFRDA